MNEKNFDDYMQAYQLETDQPPSRQLADNIISVPNYIMQSRWSFVTHPWHLFDLMMPKAIGWALTCCIGIYFGLYSTENGVVSFDEEYYLYDQAQILLSEELTQDLSGEGIR